jgi:hypothetical protein
MPGIFSAGTKRLFLCAFFTLFVRLYFENSTTAVLLQAAMFKQVRVS